MSIFKDLTSPEIQPFIEENIFSSEIKLDNEIKSLLSDFFKKNKATDVNVGDYTSHVKFSNGNSTVFPNQYYAIASACFDYATELSKYCSFCKEFVNTEKNKTKLLETKGDKQLVSDLLYKIIGDRLEEIDREMFGKFYCDEKYRPGRSFFNKDSIRNTDDIFDSNLLKIIHVPDASSSFLGKLIRMLVESNDVYSSLNDYIKKIQSEQNKSISTTQLNVLSPFTPSQIIYYGVPGCGKSHKITTMLKDEKVKDPAFSEENQVVRTTFHPEYTNADFVGQVMPKVNDGDVEYEFKPGPFAVILKRALRNPSKPFYLVIEEINRGNAAAIFGDVFQLLDRLKNGDTTKEPIGTDGFENHYGKGWSEYFVMNADVNAYIRDANSEDELDTKAIDVSGIHFSSSTGLRLPPNLSIYATMNTSDQNVFTLDNAFQRRWDMELVPNTCNWDDEDHKKQAQSPICDTDICWETFRDVVNSEISGGDFFNADDKQLGLFFIEADGGKIDQKKFANKVLKYLWADVFKRDTGKIFKFENLSKVVEDFTGTDAFDKVFTAEFAQSLKDTNDAIKNR